MIKFHKVFNSLQFQLIFWSVLSLLLLAVVAGGYGFWYNYNEINDFQDDNLKNTAALLEQSLDINGLHTNIVSSDNVRNVSTNIHFDTDDDDGAITVDIVGMTAQPASFIKDDQNNDYDYAKPITTELLTNIPSGISDQEIDGHTWRTYRNNVNIKSFSSTEKVALILRQQTDLQDDLAKASALQSFLPLIIGIALLMLLLPFIMWRMMKPVRQLHQEISIRNENDLSPLQIEKLPSELLPLAESLNRLLSLVKVSIERQQRFIADAAHELRSPLTAISLQLQRLQRITHDSTMSEGLDKLAIRLKRNQSLVEQLLTLARVGNMNNSIHNDKATTSVKFIVEQVISLLIPIADNKNIAMTVNLQSSNKVAIDETSLLVLIKNLIQNAIIYTPANGQVIINLYQLGQHSESLEKSILNTQYDFGSHVIHSEKLNTLSKRSSSRLALQIIDSGPGIHSSDYENIFEPFVRLNQSSNVSDLLSTNSSDSRSDSARDISQQIQGTGLGLFIVKSICEQASIDVFMNDSKSIVSTHENNRGLCLTLVF
ncbi:sensor histidine kinase [Psychrobacter sp.]|uniref:sensor histidine kinase n=1 Tax=Psychrobacter sp. TaxID=56811 RepID=UPI003BAE2CC7